MIQSISATGKGSDAAANTRVIILDAQSKGLVGSLSPYIGNMSFHREISLQNNTFRRQIPPELGRLFRFQVLNLENNSFQGQIPSNFSLCSSLKILYLSYNKLIGKIPFQLSNLSKLIQLYVPDNYLNGPIPPSIGNLTLLKSLSARENFLIGTIPDTLGQLKRLSIFDISTNKLAGVIPPAIYNISTITGFSVYENLLHGSILSNIGLLLPQLQFIQIWGNNFSGPLPVSLSNATKLEEIDLSLNNFIGKVDVHFEAIPLLSFLSLGGNSLGSKEGDDLNFITSLLNHSHLSVLDLQHNRLKGILPNSKANLSSSLQWLSIGQNQIHGGLPQWFFTLVSLTTMSVQFNQITGTIPMEIGNLEKLQQLVLDNNRLSGSIPSSIGNLSSLILLQLDDNNFHSTLPSSLENWRNMLFLDLSRSNFFGKLPEYLEKLSLEYLNLSSNNFEGKIPIKGVFANASAIFVEGNNWLCGGIPELKLPRCLNHQKSKRRKLDVVKFVTIAASGVLTIMVIFLYCKFKKKTNKERPPNNMLIKEFLNLSYVKILKATNGFSPENLLGVGSFGAVYKGNLEENGTLMAVKVVNLEQQGAAKSFMAECKVLQNIRHRNLVRIITSCSSIDFQGNDFKVLVYEYTPNGNLEKWLHPSPEMYAQPMEQPNLNLPQRMNIAIDVGNALDYLHCGCQEPIIHCDLKPSNILLDNDMVAHIGDFGLAKFIPQLMNPVQSSSLGVRGTIGYTAPDPVLLQEDEGVMEGRKVECLVGMIKFGVSCSMESPQDRMDMGTAVLSFSLGTAQLSRHSILAEYFVIE
ncbi:hypothetical protein JCGZ_05018 [Jatropha curcas]|uniref:Protein kinase domain-containing protein n=1 Tax=Jatropha curcas TaxID=180498 RepID=A0A067KRM0_JATCU|nr:hypothetical protein JCGZ_05018 [Jatropha curcas]